jgi:hypothetical protein
MPKLEVKPASLLLRCCGNVPSPIRPALEQLTAFFDPDFSQLVDQLMGDPVQMEDFHSLGVMQRIQNCRM